MNRAALAVILALRAFVATGDAGDWPQFRGPGGQGHAAAANLPVTWSETENVVWKSPVPGLGWSSPVIAGERIFLTTAVPVDAGHSLRVLCLDAADGAVAWSTEVFVERADEAPRIHSKNSHASPTPVLGDGRVFAHFGHLGTACLDFDGKVLWKSDDLAYRPVHGGGGSPVLHGNLLIFNCDGAADPFIAARDTIDGHVVWRTPRRIEVERKFAFSTPLVVEVGGDAQVVSAASGAVVAYDPANGKEIWRVDYGDGYSVVPRPVAGDGRLFVSSGYDRAKVLAIRLDPAAAGDVTDSHVLWEITRRAPRNASPLLVGDALFFVSDSGTASCVDAATGDVHWSERVGGQTSASPTFADGKIYFIDEQGEGTVVAPGREFTVLGKNAVPGRTFASFAVIDGAIILRSEHAIYRIAGR